MTDIILELGLTREEFEGFQPYDYLVRNAKKIPNEIAITDGETTLTWKELFEMTKRIARELRERGVQPGDIVATRLPPILSVFFAWAIFHEAAVFLTYFDGLEETPAITFRFVVSNSPIDDIDPSRLILIDDAWFEKIHMNSIIIDQRHYPTPESISRFVTSSGTTGRPKLMPFSWSASIQRAIDSHNRSRSKTVVLTTFSVRAETGWHNAFGSALLQRPHLIARDAMSYIQLMKQFHVDVFRASPVHLAEFADALESTGERLPDLVLIIPVGGRLPDNVSDTLQRLTSAQIGNGYGATEVGPMSMRYTTSRDHSDAGSIDPITEVQIVDDETHHVLPDGDVGLVRARTLHMVHEYPGNPEATKRHFRDGWFYPGDYGRIVNNNVFLEGRADELINQGGTKIDPVLIEEAFADIPEIRGCAAFGLVDDTGISRISIAYVADRKLDGEWLRAQVEPRLGRRTPRNFFRVPEIPLGETGKPLRRELVNLVTLATAARDDSAESTPVSNPSPPPADSAVEIPWPLADHEILQPFDYVVKHALARPDDIALTDGDSSLSWRDLRDVSKSIAAELRARGITSGDRVGVMLPGFMTVVVMWGIFHEAAVFSPIAPNLGTTNPFDFKLVISNRLLPDWSEEHTLIVDLEWIQSIRGKHAEIQQLRYDSPDSELHLSLTSGSTGTPKAIAFTIAESTVRAIENYRWTAASVKGMSFMPPRSQGWIPFYYNAMLGTTYLVPSDARHNAQLIRRFGVDVIRASPVQLADLVEELERTGNTLPSLSLILATGGHLPEPLRQALKRVSNAQIGNAYGATEVGGVSMRRVDSTEQSDTGPIFPGVDVEILDRESHLPLSEGETGLIRMRGAVTSSGYLGNPEASSEHFRDGWFYPGDLGRIVDGHLVVVGRGSQLINAGGSKIDPVVVEQAFLGYLGISDCAAFELKDSRGIRRVALAYVGPIKVDAPTAQSEMNHRLGSAVPSWYIRVPEIPRGDTGKVQRGRLTERFAELAVQSTSTPTTDDGEFVQPFDFARRGWQANPDAPALIDKSGVLTRKDVAIRAKQYAMFLRERGVQPGDIVMIQLDTVLQLTFTLAVFHEAAVIAPYVEDVVRAGSLDVRWVISSERLLDVPEFKNIVVTPKVLAAIGRNQIMSPAREYPGPDALLRISFSSGTTGTPKPIAFAVGRTAARALDHESRTMSTTQFMCLMPPVRGMGWWSWYASVIQQRPYIIPNTPSENIKLMRRLGVDSIVASPVQVAVILRELDESQTTLPDLRVIQIAGSSLSPTLVDEAQRLTRAHILNLYGTTEVGPTSVRRDANDDPAYVGELLPGIRVEIVDATTREPVADGEVGLVRAQSDTMAHEYLGNEEATAEAWQDGWFYSGDLGYLNDGKLYLAGRTSEIINAGGGKIDPAVIDAYFDSETPFIDHAAFAISSPHGFDRIGLAYVSSEPVDIESIASRATAALKFHAPAHYSRVQEIPRNELGKPLRLVLAAQFDEPNDQER